MVKLSVSWLTSAPPGYVVYEEVALLTEASCRRPCCWMIEVLAIQKERHFVLSLLYHFEKVYFLRKKSSAILSAGFLIDQWWFPSRSCYVIWLGYCLLCRFASSHENSEHTKNGNYSSYETSLWIKVHETTRQDAMVSEK